MAIIQKFFRSTVAGPLVALLLVSALVSLATDRFLMPANLSNVSLQVATVAVVSIGATLVILTGGIDLSPGSTVALVTCTLAILVKKMGIPLPIGILLVLLLGVACGAINGFFSTYGRIPSFIVTLATMSIYRGLAFLITGGTPIFSVSDALEPLFYGRFLGIPLPFYYVIILYALASLFLRNTIPGRAIYAVGGNESAARLTGIAVNRSKMIAFLIAGLSAGIGGVLLTAWLNSGSPNYGQELGLQSIAAAVIGGASLAGGIGTVPGAILGALIMASLDNGMSMLNTEAFWQYIVKGAMLVFAVWIDVYTNKKRD